MFKKEMIYTNYNKNKVKRKNKFLFFKKLKTGIINNQQFFSLNFPILELKLRNQVLLKLYFNNLC